MGICMGTAMGQARPSRMPQGKRGDSWEACPGQGDWGRPAGWVLELSFSCSKSYILMPIRWGLCRHRSSRIQAYRDIQVCEGRCRESCACDVHSCEICCKKTRGHGRLLLRGESRSTGRGRARAKSGLARVPAPRAHRLKKRVKKGAQDGRYHEEDRQIPSQV
jgi:hypothetical protein